MSAYPIQNGDACREAVFVGGERTMCNERGYHTMHTVTVNGWPISWRAVGHSAPESSVAEH